MDRIALGRPAFSRGRAEHLPFQLHTLEHTADPLGKATDTGPEGLPAV